MPLVTHLVVRRETQRRLLPVTQSSFPDLGDALHNSLCFRVLAAVLFVVSLASHASAETVESTPVGGPWHLGATWVGGTVPLAGDDVVLEGPVTVDGPTSCANLDLSSGGRVAGGSPTPTTLEVNGTITNAGTIENGVQIFTIKVGSDLNNDGIWTNWNTICTGTSDQHLSQSATAVFESDLIRDETATGDLVIDTPFPILGDIDYLGGRVVLGPGGSITLRQGLLSGEIACGGGEVRFEAGSTLYRGVMDAGVLVGTARASSAFSFTNGLTVMDELTHSTGGSHLIIEGTLVNHGLIRNGSYGLTISLFGDLECYGTFTNSYIAMEESVEHRLRMGPEGNLDSNLILPEFGDGSLIVEADSRISDGVSLGQNGSMTLLPGVSLQLTGGTISGGTLWAGGNDIYAEGVGGLYLNQADQVVLHGVAQAGDGTFFTGGLRVAGVVQNWEFAPSEIWVEGDLLIEGELRDNVQTLTVHATGNLLNRGSISNHEVIVDGTGDQLVEIGAGIEATSFIVDAGFASSTYQWFRDDVPLAAENSRQLVFAIVDVADVGIYHCEGGDGQISRDVVFEEGAITATSDPYTQGHRTESVAWLGAVRPNPMRLDVGRAEIELGLPERGFVSLSLFDAGGREISKLFTGQIEAGFHLIPVELGRLELGRRLPGVLFLKMTTAAGSDVRKLIIVH